MSLQLQAAVFSHQGKVRTNNEDNYRLFDEYRHDSDQNILSANSTIPMQASVVAVCDGMGGETAGEVASLIAVEQLHPCQLSQIKESASHQIMTANKIICDEIEKRGGTRIGTTIAALYIDKGKAVACNVGDSRVYLYRNGSLCRLTVDHSEAQRLVDMGVMDEAQAKEDKRKHRLTQHLGIFSTEFEIDPFFSDEIALQKDDEFLLCSDGLTDMLEDSDIADELSKNQPSVDTADNLVRKALERGGKDNITVIVMKVQYHESETNKRMKNDLVPQFALQSVNKRLVYSIVVTICVLVFLGYVGIKAYQMKAYSNAVLYISQGEYEKAYQELSSDFISDDGVELRTYLSDYLRANNLLAWGQYESAKELLVQLGNFGNSYSLIEECNYGIEKERKQNVYDTAVKRMAQGQYLEAAELFDSLADFEDSSVKAANCRKPIYRKALDKQKDQNYSDAIALYELLGDYEDSKERCQYCQYHLAFELMDSGLKCDMIEAKELFSCLGNYKESKKMMEICDIKIMLWDEPVKASTPETAISKSKRVD